MALFSQRKGIRPLQKAIQRESMDNELRIQLWNAWCMNVWEKWQQGQDFSGYNRLIDEFVSSAWTDYFRLPIDECPEFNPARHKSTYSYLRDHFMTAEWWEVFDLVEFLLRYFAEGIVPNLRRSINYALESENSAYRVVNDEITEITDEQEIQSIEDAFDCPSQGSRKHFENALKLLSDRKAPDYPNSIKESISAVESACRTVSGNPKATLGNCLKAIQKNRPLHTAFKEALSKLYGYTSDEGGIRHSLSEAAPAQLTYADAKFMLVTCTAFVNYLFTRAAEDSLPLSSK